MSLADAAIRAERVIERWVKQCLHEKGTMQRSPCLGGNVM